MSSRVRIRAGVLLLVAAAMAIATIVAVGVPRASAQDPLGGRQRQIQVIAVGPDAVNTTPADFLWFDIGAELEAVQNFLRDDVDQALRFSDKEVTLLVPPSIGAIEYRDIVQKMLADGYDDPDTLYLVFANVEDPFETRECRSTGNTKGVEVAVVWTASCEESQLVGQPHDFPEGASKQIVQTVLESLGAVPQCAPNENKGGVDDSLRDVLYRGSQAPATQNLTVDFGRDDYFGHGRKDCLDVADNPVWVPKAQCPTGAFCEAAPEPKMVASQSSTYGGYAVAERAIDGDIDGRWAAKSVASTNSETNPWWQVDLGVAAPVREVVVWNRTDCCTERLSDFYVMVSDRPFSSNDLKTLIADPNVTAKRVQKRPSPSVAIDFGEKSARYVRVQINGTGFLSLAEVEVNTTTSVVASQSSTYGGNAAASRAVDGNTDGKWSAGSVASTNRESQPWWQVDLGKSVSIDDVVVWNRTDCCAERLSDFYVLASNQPFKSADLATLLADPYVISRRVQSQPNPSTRVNFAGKNARYVRVQLNGTNHLSLAEVEIVRSLSVGGRKASQSSTYGGYAEADRAIDNKTDGRWAAGSVASTDLEKNPWWQVDLGREMFLPDITVWNRTDCCSQRLSDFYIMTSSQPFASDNLATLLADPNVTAWRVEEPPNPSYSLQPVFTSGRYVRIQLNGTGYLSLAEVAIEAYPR